MSVSPKSPRKTKEQIAEEREAYHLENAKAFGAKAKRIADINVILHKLNGMVQKHKIVYFPSNGSDTGYEFGRPQLRVGLYVINRKIKELYKFYRWGRYKKTERTTEKLVGVFVPLVLGDGLRYLFQNSRINPVSDGFDIREQLPAFIQGFAIKNALTISFHLLARTNGLVDADNGQYILPNDVFVAALSNYPTLQVKQYGRPQKMDIAVAATDPTLRAHGITEQSSLLQALQYYYPTVFPAYHPDPSLRGRQVTRGLAPGKKNVPIGSKDYNKPSGFDIAKLPTYYFQSLISFGCLARGDLIKYAGRLGVAAASDRASPEYAEAINVINAKPDGYEEHMAALLVQLDDYSDNMVTEYNIIKKYKEKYAADNEKAIAENKKEKSKAKRAEAKARKAANRVL